MRMPNQPNTGIKHIKQTAGCRLFRFPFHFQAPILLTCAHYDAASIHCSAKAPRWTAGITASCVLGSGSDENFWAPGAPSALLSPASSVRYLCWLRHFWNLSESSTTTPYGLRAAMVA